MVELIYVNDLEMTLHAKGIRNIFPLSEFFSVYLYKMFYLITIA